MVLQWSPIWKAVRKPQGYKSWCFLMCPLGIHLFTFYNTLESSHQNVWQWKKARKTPLTHCWATVKLYTLSLHRTIRLCQPCQNLPKGVACQSAQCVRTRQEPGWITGPAWPGAPSCPWTTAQLWTGNKRWEISYKPTDVPKGLKNKQTKKILSLFKKKQFNLYNLG